MNFLAAFGGGNLNNPSPHGVTCIIFKEEEGKMKCVLKYVSFLVLAGFFVQCFSSNTEAIPAFARKYKTSCVLCHAPFPKLTAMGEAFRLNGYKIPEGDEIYVKEEPVSMGAEPYKKMFPEAIWPSTIPGIPPLAIRVIGDANYYPNGAHTNRNEFNYPAEVTLLGAGSFGDNFAFFAQMGVETEDGESTISPLAWLMWQNLFPNIVGQKHLNFKVGNVGRHSITLPNTRNENSFTVDDYLYVTALDLDNEPGFEAVGYDRNWRYVVGLVDADRDNSKKDYYAAFDVKLGGIGYDGSGGTYEAGGLGTSPSGYWRDDSVQIGAFAYRSHVGVNADNFDRIGADVLVNYKNISLAGGYVYGRNYMTNERMNIEFAETQYFVYPWMVPYLRFENLSMKESSTGDQARFVFGSTMLLRANIRFNVEAELYTTNDPAYADTGSSNADNVITCRMDWAF